MILRLLVVLFAVLALIGWADVERPLIRLATGRDLVRVVVVIPQHAEHRWLRVDGAVFTEDGENTWERVSWEQLDGANAPLQRTMQWTLPRRNPFDVGARRLNVSASVVCEQAEGQAYIP